MVVLGKVDHGDHTRPQDEVKDGDHGLVFLFRPFLGGWSQTMGTFCTAGAAPGSVLAKLILQYIIPLTNATVLVQAITCENSTTNQAPLRALGISAEGDPVTSFEHPTVPDMKVTCIIDVPHIFKCIRNNLLKVGKFILPGGKEVYHRHYQALLEYEEQQCAL
ncbi:uncharacterized protein LOC135392825 [Ornithodoros turicata]|uniref:uncharacterized protein LOC135392825 n=1 Tax=Ornithodoros turicata TaxID=34597 RepID=UPI00313A0EFE